MREAESFLELLKIDHARYSAVAVVGGGGKTSLIYRLCAELLNQGKKVIITTTTHMAYEPLRPFARDGKTEEVKKLLEEYGYAVAAAYDRELGKLASPGEGKLMELRKLCDVMLVEADGSRQKPVKVPEEWEPVIPAFADIVISVVGLDCLGQPICETAHRAERMAELLKKGMEAPVTSADIVKITTSICGLFKDVEDRVYRVYLNKADVLEDSAFAGKIVEELLEEGTVAAFGSLKET